MARLPGLAGRTVWVMKCAGPTSGVSGTRSAASPSGWSASAAFLLRGPRNLISCAVPARKRDSRVARLSCPASATVLSMWTRASAVATASSLALWCSPRVMPSIAHRAGSRLDPPTPASRNSGPQVSSTGRSGRSSRTRSSSSRSTGTSKPAWCGTRTRRSPGSGARCARRRGASAAKVGAVATSLVLMRWTPVLTGSMSHSGFTWGAVQPPGSTLPPRTETARPDTMRRGAPATGGSVVSRSITRKRTPFHSRARDVRLTGSRAPPPVPRAARGRAATSSGPCRSRAAGRRGRAARPHARPCRPARPAPPRPP